MVDILLKIVALAGFVAFSAVLAVRVPEPSLVTVLIIVSLMAAYDFFVDPYIRRNGKS
jgi:hypothetical protein